MATRHHRCGCAGRERPARVITPRDWRAAGRIGRPVPPRASGPV